MKFRILLYQMPKICRRSSSPDMNLGLSVPEAPEAYFPEEFVNFLGTCRGLMDGVWKNQHRLPIKGFLDSIPPKEKPAPKDTRKVFSLRTLL